MSAPSKAYEHTSGSPYVSHTGHHHHFFEDPYTEDFGIRRTADLHFHTSKGVDEHDTGEAGRYGAPCTCDWNIWEGEK